MKNLTEEDLHGFLQLSGGPRQRRVSRAVEEVRQVVQQLTAEISARDSRFQTISNSGVHSDSLKVMAPSQFLVTVPLRGLSGFRQRSTRRWRYYTPSGVRLLTPVMEPEKMHQWLEVEQFQKSTPHWHESDVNIQGDVVPARVVSVFQGLLLRAICTCNLSDKVSVMESIGPVIRVNVETSVQPVEVELVPMIEVPGCWPKKARWPRFLKRWPSKDRAQCVKSFGFDLLARSNYHWQLSFLRAERLLLDAMDEDGGCRGKCLRVLRQMKEDVWCPGNRPVITSQHLQMVVLWACERHPGSKSWQDFVRCFLRLVRRLLKCTRQRFLRHFFVRRANLLKYADPVQLEALADTLSRFLRHPSITTAAQEGNSSAC
ncbi:protein mab-21-like 3 isoform X2 [Spea bombifrons]|uniref:protein mab-21-like 3 isoform X2 n=1 Tax=Spea bombifrons TaxID=233779 RepID=UPI00234AEA11|nr:protein mab-21-like 3 isoform X2 [Spea bombifrons]